MSITWYVDKISGSATNSGSSEGFPKASGSQAIYTSGDTTIDLSTDNPDLSLITPSGDTIYLQSATGGLWDSITIFAIIAIDDVLKTITISSAPTNTNTGKSWTIGGAFSTMQRAVDSHVAAAKENTCIKSSAVYTEAVISDHVLGDSNVFVIWEGYNITPGDGGIVEIDGQDIRAIGIDFPTKHVVIKNFHVHNHTSHGINTGDHGRIINCETDHNGNNGIQCTHGGIFLKCYSHENTNFGLLSAQGQAIVLCCVLNDNSGLYGLACAGGVVWKTIANGNAGVGLSIEGETGILGVVLDSFIDGKYQNTIAGIEFLGYMEGAVVINTLIYNCVSGIKGVEGVGFPPNVFSYNNLVNGNTIPYTNFGTTSGEVTSAPLFVNEGIDYTPASGSPAIEAGIDQVDFGIMAMVGNRSSIGGIEPVSTINPDYPSIGDVRYGILFDSNSQSGTLVLPSPNNVREGIGFGSP